MSARLGHDFARVRIHSDDRGDASARAVGAEAYAVGEHVVLRNRSYDFTSPRDSYLISHELAHVAQQTPSDGPITLGAPEDPAETEAEAAASAVARGGRATVRRSSPATTVRRVPTGIEVAEEKPFGHGDLKDDELKQKWRTYLGATTLMKATPAGDYTGHCAKEHLTEVANTCPAERFSELRQESFCEKSWCLDFNRYKSAMGDGNVGKSVVDGPSTFIDLHRTRHPQSLLEGTKKKECSVVCHQLYKFDRKDVLGAFYVIRNFRAGTYTPPGAKKPLHITTGEIRKVPAPSTAPTAGEFAAKTAPELVKKGVLADAPAAPKAAEKKKTK